MFKGSKNLLTRDCRGLTTIEYLILFAMVAAVVVIGWRIFGEVLVVGMGRKQTEFFFSPGIWQRGNF